MKTEMDSELIITHASQLITLAGPARPRIRSEMGELAMIDDGAVLIRDGLIAATGESRAILSQAGENARVIDAAGSVVMPGYVDAHTHPVFAGTREDEYCLRAAGLTYQEIAARGGGILSTVRKTRAASEQELFGLALPRVQRFLSYGTTTIEAKSGYGLTLDDELKILRVIRRLARETPLDVVPTFLGAHEIPAEFRNPDEPGQGRGEYLRLVTDEMLPAVARERLARFCDVFCETHVFTPEESRTVLNRAGELGLGARLHAEQLTLCGGARLGAELGAATVDHLENIDTDGIALLSVSGVIGVLLPGAVFNLGSTRFAPARKLIDAGVPVVLATDFNPGSSPTPSMQMIHSIACTQMRMTPAECITASTINAAYSLSLGGQIGSLEVGKQGDVVIFDCADYRQIPYFFGVNHVRAVVKRGEIVAGPKND
jgi:imidazolonepropionase